MSGPTIFGLSAVQVEKFGGLNTLLDPTNLPLDVSPDTKDCAYAPGLVKTRPGLNALRTYPGSPTINYTKSYKQPNLTQLLLAFTGEGYFYSNNALISDLMLPNTYANSVSLFGREYIAFSDGKFGTDIPRQFDGTNFDRVSQVGPGAGPINIRDFVVEITTITRTAGVMDVTTGTPHGLVAGDNVQLSNVFNTSPMDAGVNFNGTWPVWNVVSTTQFQAWQLFKSINLVSLSRIGGTVFAQLVKAPPATFTVGMTLIIQGATGFNGVFTLLNINGQTVTWLEAKDDAFAYSNGTLTMQSPVSSGVNTTSQDGLAHLGFVEPSDQRLDVRVGYGVTLAGVSAPVIQGPPGSVPTFNGSWTCVLLQPDTDVFFFTQHSFTFAFPHDGNYFALASGGNVTITIPDATATGGFSAAAGNVTAGVHQVSVAFKTRQGYITRPSPPVNFLSAGGTRLQLTGIPIGPSNILQRIILFTGSSGAAFFYTPATIIEDNTTTTEIIDVSDLELLSGESGDALFRLVELGECAGVTAYASRLIWSGERNKIDNFLNLTFDGGFNGNVPLGWDLEQFADGAGGTKTTDAIWGDAYQIASDAALNVRGLISQGAYQDFFKVPILYPDTNYSIRVSMKSPLAVTGQMIFDIFSPVYGVLAAASVNGADIGTDWEEFVINFSAKLPAKVPTDTRLRIYGYWSVPVAGETIILDDIQFFPTDQPYNTSIARVSKPEDPESYDGVDGFLAVAENNGQVLMACKGIRDFLYLGKQNSLYVTADDGQNEPALWTIREVSSKVGTTSVRGFALGDEWAILGNRDGVFLFNGSEPEKISQEIQPTWDALDWNESTKLDIHVDIRLKRIYVGCVAAEKQILTLDFVEGFVESARKWNPWRIKSNSISFVEDGSNSEQLYIGNSVANGKLYFLDPTVLSDDGVAINSYWQSGYFALPTRNLLGYLSANVTGTGVVGLVAYFGDQNRTKALRGWTLSAHGDNNKERQVQVIRERLAIKLSTAELNHSFSLQGMYMWVKPSPTALIRGHN